MNVVSSIQEEADSSVPNLLSPLHANEISLKQGSGSPLNPSSNSRRREIGDLAVWSLSSAKHGNGVEQLRDNQVTTFW